MPLQQAAAAATAEISASSCPSLPSPKKKKKKNKKRKSGDHGEEAEEQRRDNLVGSPGATGGGGSGGDGGGGGGAVQMAEAMMPFRPALEVHGWLLDLDTRCRFWSAVLESSTSSAAASAAASALPSTTPQHSGDKLVEEEEEGESVEGDTAPDPPCPPPPGFSSIFPAEGETGEEAKALPRILATAAAALEMTRRGDSNNGSGGIGSNAAREEGAAGVRRKRLEKTLQQVAVHRVQQIYARLNGISDPEAAAADAGSPGTGSEAASAAVKDDHARLEQEARGLVAFACGSCGEGGGGGGGGGSGLVGWGDEGGDGGGSSGGGGACWSVMMPYLPVWVGFAAREQVGEGGCAC